jgi:ATPase subunit of ABC transporter with duplicated ATPase domains
MLISFLNFGLIIGEKELIKESSFSIEEKEKVGLIGRNGSGKSTLLELVYQKYKGENIQKQRKFSAIQTSGRIIINPNLKIAYLPQEIKFDFEGSVKDYLNSCSSFYLETINRFEDLNKKKKENHLSREEELELKSLLEKMNSYNLWKFRVERMKVLENLSLENLINKDIKDVSGGEATRVGLAGIFLSDADFWILDEPTNNLDYEGIDLLFRKIKEFKGGILIVTHDRKLLDVLKKIIEIDEETKKIKIWGGNYSFYKEKKEEEYEARLRKYEAQLEKKKSLEEEVLRLKKIALSLEDKSSQTKAVKLVKRAKAIETRISRELANLNEPRPPEKPTFPKPKIEKLAGFIFRLINISFAYSPEKEIIKNLNLEINSGDRLLIKGKNGTGKTTLLKIILGEIEPTKGIIKRKQNLNIGYLPQSPLMSNKKEKVKNYLKNFYSLTEDDIKKILNLMQISEVYSLDIENLSIGEIRRIQLAAILFKNPEVLILDEPTNHLDVYTIEDLTFVLKDYEGTLVFTSHDDYFIRDIKPNKELEIC